MSYLRSIFLSYRGLSLYLLGIVVAVLLAGCGSSSHSLNNNSPGNNSSLFTEVVFNFQGYDQQSAQGRVMPANTKQVRFTGCDSSGNILFEPQKHTAAQRITLNEVSISVSNFLVEYLTEQDQVLALDHKDVVLRSEKVTTVNFSQYTPLNESLKSLTIQPAVASVVKGYGQQFLAKLLLNDGYSTNITSQCTWS